MKNKMPYSVPPGYFESLESRLLEIPAEVTATKTDTRRIHVGRFTPYLALAASFVAAAVIGTTILVRTTEPVSSGASEDDIIEYLIDSGVTLAQLEYLENN